MQHLDEGTIHAWLDGALSADEAARTEAHVASCATCADAVAEARGLVAAASRILLALDEVPNVGGAKGAKGATWRRRSLPMLLVRERIAAAAALVVAGGALALALSRGAPKEETVYVASETARPVELTVADSPMPPPIVAGDARKEAQAIGDVGARGAAISKTRARDFAAAFPQESGRPSLTDTAARLETMDVAAKLPTDDSLQSEVVAQAQRAEALPPSAEAKSSVAERLRRLSRPNAAAETPSRFAEPTTAEGGRGAVTGAAGDTRLVHDERMIESGREVRRRIYRIDDILVTLDERLPTALDMARQTPPANVAAPPARSDSTLESTNTIRWTDARGAELTLTGPASLERLERIRKLLGY